MEYLVRGTILSSRDSRGVSNLRIEAWDKDLLIDDLLGTAKTDSSGRFTINFDSGFYQEICFDRRPDVYFKVFCGNKVVCSTENSILWNVSDSDIQITLSVDLPSSPDDIESRPRSFNVKGRIAEPDGTALASWRVVAFDKQFGKEKILGITQTDVSGRYAIRYSLDDLANPAKGSADLIVRVYKDSEAQEPLASSPLILNALEEETINLSVGDEPYRGRSEHAVVSERLQPLLDQMKGGELSDQDFVHLSDQTGLGIEKVQLYAEAAVQSQRTKVEASVLYGLYRSGMPYSFAALIVQNPETLRNTLKQAQAKNIIASMDDEAVEMAVETIHTNSAKELLENDSPGQVHAAKLFDLLGLSASEKKSILKHYSITIDDQPEKFWDGLEESAGLGPKKAKALRRIFELNALSLNHLPLVEKLSADQAIKSPKDLASMNAEDWNTFLKNQDIPAPEQVPGKNAVGKRENYALILSRIVEDVFPTTAFSSGWIKDHGLDTDISDFFQKNPDFAFESKGINAYLEENPQVLDGMADKEVKAYRFKLQAVQNLFRIGHQFERIKTVKILWQDNIHSAHAIKRMGEEKFVAKYGETIGKVQAKLVYAKAEKVAGFTLLALAKYAWDTNSITPYAIPKTDLKANPNDDARATLTSIFGSLDFCDCKHCRSVLGPAAYLVDTLMFLDNSTAKDGDTGLEKFFARRPDIGNIKLNCENTNTPLPYIDLVNEVLENVIIPRTYTQETHDGTTIYKGEVYQTDEKRPNFLQATPEHINPDAYDELWTAEADLDKPVTDSAWKAVFPWLLPFNLWAEEARTYLGQLGVKRHELMEVFRGSGAASPSASDVLCEFLAINPDERKLLTTSVNSTDGLKRLWGVKSGSLIGTIKKVSDFLQRIQTEYPQLAGTQSRYPQLEALLQCSFINPPDASAQIKISFDEAYPCSLDHAELTNLTNLKLDKLHRFIRLRHKLGWSFFDLDRTLTAFGKSNIDVDFLDKLSGVIAFKKQLNVDLLTAICWWAATLDTAEYKDTPSQYNGLFLNKAVGILTESVKATLTLNAAGDELSATDKSLTDPNYETVVLGAAKIRKDDLALIIDEDLENSGLNLAHLSHVFRVASFSQAVGISINEYYLLKLLTGIQPLSSPPTVSEPAGHIATPQDTKDFVKAWGAVSESGISLEELVYLLAHNTTQSNNNKLSEEVIAQRLTEMREGLAAIYWANQMPSEGLDAVLAKKLGDIMEGEEIRNAAMLVILGESPLAEADQKAYIDNDFHFDDFLDATEAKDKLVGPVNALGNDITARLTYVLEPLLAYLVLRQSQRYIEQKLSESLSLTVDGAFALRQMTTNPDDNTQSAEDLLLDTAFVTSTDTVDMATYSSQFKVYERIYKASRLINGVTTTSVDQAFIVRNGSAVGWPDINDLPLVEITSSSALSGLFERYIAMTKALNIGPRILTSGATFTEFLGEVVNPSLTMTQIKQRLADSTDWSLDDIQTLATNFGYGITDLRKSAWLVQLYKAFSILKRLGIRAAQAWAWNAADATFDLAVQIKFAVKSKYDDKEWFSIAPALRDPLREKQRDALLAYIIHDKDFKDADDVYGYFLIDPQMSACRDTSRIKNAISSVQLFVQRVLMSLEKDEIEFEYADAKQWKWRKNYRVWEANRKVFLWPENWIYPELRDDKSPFFKEMEDELYQSDIDNRSAERALMSYLKKLDEVAHLDVCGMYEDAEQKILHVVARTLSAPHKYFYRKWVNGQHWTAWEPVDADIDGDHLLPVVHNRRLFLFWPKFTEKAQEVSGGTMTDVRNSSKRPDDPAKYYEIQIAWTQHRDGKWREMQVSKDCFSTIYSPRLRAKSEYYFFAEHTSNKELFILCRLIPAGGEGDQAITQILYYNDITDAVELYKFKLEELNCEENGQIIIENVTRHSILNKLPDGDNIFMKFEKVSNGTELKLLTKAEVHGSGYIYPSTKETRTLLTAAEEGFGVMLPHQHPTYKSQAPFFYLDSRRVFFVEPRDIYQPIGLSPSGTFNVPDVAYFFDNENKALNGIMAGLNHSDIFKRYLGKRDFPFFHNKESYFLGNKASGMVIDRDKQVAVGYGRKSRGGIPENIIARNATSQTTLFTEGSKAVMHTQDKVNTGTTVDLDTVSEQKGFYIELENMGWKFCSNKKFHFQTFYHPYIPLMIQQLNRYGLEGLLAPTADHGNDWDKLKRQQIKRDEFIVAYSPNTIVVDVDDKRRPKEEFDFVFGGAYSQYNWELFFHTPLLIAERLMQDQKFEEAQKWFHYIFDPTETEGDAPKRFWKIKPFFEFDDETSIAKLMELLNEGDEEVEAQVEAWENDPFNPHHIARMRIVAYMRTVVMKYIDNLIAWGDSLFRRFSIESLNEAVQIYVLAAQILGKKPERIEKTDVSAYTFNELFSKLDEFSNASVPVESSLPWMTTHRTGSSSGESSVLDTLYFCIPQNEKLLEYWNTVADRLFKLRNCMDIEGVRRQPPLFEPPIDPGLLVKARASGLDLSSVLSELFAPLPYYRFRVMLQRANEFCADVKALGGLLLQTLEKRDAEALSMLRATNQVELLKSLHQLKQKAIVEATHNREALLERKQIAEIRYNHYDALDFMNPAEIVGVSLSGTSIITHGIGVIMEALAGGMHSLPQFTMGAAGFGGTPVVTTATGGESIGSALGKAASVLMQTASIIDKGASLSYTIASYMRRQEEWDLQRDVADKEIEDIKKQILAADIRIEMAKKDLESHELQIEQSDAESEFLESKFTNKELYNWMVTQVSTLYFQSYQMAYDIAKKAEQCFRHELGVQDTNYIQFGYWDSLKKGLLAGERLQKDIRRLEAAYLEQNRREFELSKNISLAQLNPAALLQLKQTGTCEFLVPEVLLDVDYPGQYMRRIKGVSLTIPCVVGPYTSVGAKLTMLENRVRTSTAKKNGKYVYQGIGDERFAHDLVGIQSIATSTGQRDSGLFEMTFGDERYLPFEGGGVISSWRLELQGKWQDDAGNIVEWSQFDYDTISDAILHVQYTARDGGDLFRKDVRGELRQSFNKIADILSTTDTGLIRIISAAHEFGNEWHKFMNPTADATSQKLTLTINKNLFSFLFQERPLTGSQIKVVVILDNPSIYTKYIDGVGSPLQVTLTHPDGSEITDNLMPDPKIGDQPALSASANFTLNDSEEKITITVDESNIATTEPALIETRDGKSRLKPAEIRDILLEVTYTVGSA